MWLLIKVENEIGIGNDEKQRILIKEQTLELNKFIDSNGIGIHITANGSEVRPATLDESDCFLREFARTNLKLYKFMTHLFDCSCVFCAEMRKELKLPIQKEDK
jgi:hypothetical protein